MKRTTLQKYLDKHSQASLASKVGISQGAISKMLRKGRNIMVHEYANGSVVLVEERQIKGKDHADNQSGRIE